MKKILLPMMLLTAMIGCKKNDNSLNTISFDDLLKNNQSQEQVFEMNAATGGMITGTEGTKITFPASSLVNIDGTPFTGKAKIVLKESLKKSTWIMDGLSATTRSGPLVSAGMLLVNVTRADNGASLRPSQKMVQPNANLNLVIKAEVPKIDNPQDTAAIEGQIGLFLPADSVGPFGPNVPQGPVGPLQPPTAWGAAGYYPFGQGTNSYIFQIPQFTWVNCDGLWQYSGSKTTVEIIPDVTDFPGATDLQGILVYRDVNTVITFPPATNSFVSYDHSIPIGSTADVICIGKTSDGKILWKLLPAVTIVADMKINIKPAIVSSAEVEAYLALVNTK